MLSLGFISFAAIFLLLFPSRFSLAQIDRIDFLFYRLSVLQETMGGGRDTQVLRALQTMSSPLDWVFGVSNAVQRFSGVSYGVESEYVNIFVNYGLVGFCMIYLALFLVFLVCRSSTVFYASGTSVSAILVLYSFFSVGYFFMAESVVGVMPWAYFGFIVGLVYRERVTPVVFRGARASEVLDT